jgi:hypothetical protein
LRARLHTRAQRAVAKTLDYLRGRQSANGGFCFYRWRGVDEPNLHDTWHALATFALLGAEIPRPAAAGSFVNGFRVGGFDELYYHALALDLLGVRVSVAQHLLDRIGGLDASAPLANAQVSITGRLGNALRTARLQRRFGSIVARDAVVQRVESLQHQGGWGDKPNLGDTWLALAVLDTCGERGFADATRHFVDDLQASSFGFTATRDSTYADLGTLHAGACACYALGLPIRHAADATDFALACQGDRGGFARTPDAAPDIALTHRGVRALMAMGVLERHDAARVRRDSGW